MPKSRNVPGRFSGVQQVLLRHWLEAVPHDRLAHLVKDAARGLSRGLQVRLADHSVSFGNWTILRILWERDGLTQRELSIEAGIMEPTTFAALKALEKLGYIRRKRKAGDRKQVFIYLTSQGAELQAKLEPLAKEVNEIAIRGVSPQHVAITRQTLLGVIRNLAADEAESLAFDRRVPSTRELSGMAKRRRKLRSRPDKALPRAAGHHAAR
jgi:MarR family transcriptional regulator, organic hydroperoxide resistance regulator